MSLAALLEGFDENLETRELGSATRNMAFLRGLSGGRRSGSCYCETHYRTQGGLRLVLNTKLDRPRVQRDIEGESSWSSLSAV